VSSEKEPEPTRQDIKTYLSELIDLGFIVPTKPNYAWFDEIAKESEKYYKLAYILDTILRLKPEIDDLCQKIQEIIEFRRNTGKATWTLRKDA